MRKDDRPNQSIVNSPGATQVGGDLVQQFFGERGWPELTAVHRSRSTRSHIVEHGFNAPSGTA